MLSQILGSLGLMRNARARENKPPLNSDVVLPVTGFCLIDFAQFHVMMTFPAKTLGFHQTSQAQDKMCFSYFFIWHKLKGQNVLIDFD